MIFAARTQWRNPGHLYDQNRQVNGLFKQSSARDHDRNDLVSNTSR